MDCKRGAAHVEIVLAFVLFVGFVIFLLIFIRPLSGGDNLSEAVVLGLVDSFLEEGSVNLTKVFVKDNKGGNCDSINSGS